MSYSEEHRAAGAFAAMTVRACDGCLHRGARWFCNADDAFLCQVCDASVHSVNPLDRRHHRIRLNSASSSSSSLRSSSPPSSVSPGADDFWDEHATPAWLHGLTRKPRTPRGKLGALAAAVLAAPKAESVVPDLEELSAEENMSCDREEQLLYCVPILDPAVLSDFCSQPHRTDDANSSGDEVKQEVELPGHDHVPAAAATPDGLAGFCPTADLDIAEFTSDMEKLLGRGLEDNEDYIIDGLSPVNEGLMEDNKGHVKPDTARGDAACDLRTDIEGVHEHKPLQEASGSKRRKVTILKLDYEAVIAAWSSNGCSPWTAGERPDLDPKDDTLTAFAPIGGGEVRGWYQQVAMAAAAVGEGREARVSRYREKRRTRLFSKKIRYEVRKLNAEKRPRMKGRFVKRAATPAAVAEFRPVAAGAATFPYL